MSRIVKTAESTFGAGLNAPRGTVNSYLGVPKTFTDSAKGWIPFWCARFFLQLLFVPKAS